MNPPADLPTAPVSVLLGGVPRTLACLPSAPAERAAITTFAAGRADMAIAAAAAAGTHMGVGPVELAANFGAPATAADWAALRPRDLYATWHTVGCLPTWDQGRSLACVGHAVEQAFAVTWLQSGGAPKLFSPTFIYGIVNGGRDGGATVAAGCNAIKNFGICEVGLVGPGKIFRTDFPPASYANARRHRAVEVWRLASYYELCLAIHLGYACFSGIWIGKNFGSLDAAGVAPLPDVVVGGHAMTLCGLHTAGGRPLVLAHNTWGDGWGFRHPASGAGGFCYLTEEHWNGIYMEAYAIAGVLRDPDLPPLPVAA